MIRCNRGSIIKWIISAFIICIPLSWAAFTFGSFYRILILLLFCVFAFVIQGVFRMPEKNGKLFAIWTVFFGYIGVCVLWSVDFNVSLQYAMGMALLWFMVLIFSSYPDEADGRGFDTFWILAGVICVVLYLFGGAEPVQCKNRGNSIENGNDFV